MKERLRILQVEDSESDAELVLRSLASLGCTLESERVQDAVSLRAALRTGAWDVILCDSAMPGFDAFGALDILHELDLDVPFVLVSGTMGEERAAESIRAGASDYVLKDNLVRLAPAVARARREALTRARQRRAEEAVKHEQERFRALVESSSDGIVVITSDAVITYASPAAGRIFGREVEALVGTPVTSYFVPEEREVAATRIRTLAEKSGSVLVGTRSVLRPDGSIRLLETTLTSRVSDPCVAGIVCNVRDVTESERTRRELTVAQVRFAKLFASGLIGISISDLAGEIVEANDKLLEMLGYTREELRGRAVDWRTLTPPEWQAWNDETRAALARDGYSPPREKEYFRKDGTRLPALVGVTMLDATQAMTLCVDLTSFKRTETALRDTELQLRHAQKMEAVGRLAGGVAHDFNNLLSVILSYADVCFEDLPEGDPIRHDIDEIRSAAKRASNLTRQLLTFSRRQVVDARVVDVNELIAGAAALLRRLLGEDIELVMELEPSLGRVRADPSALEQVVMNLAVNARDAMPRGGRITLCTSNVSVERSDRGMLTVEPGPYVLIAVSDTGAGMDEHTQQHLFEPFFTTKAVGKGTGLGLSTVFGIVQQCGGHVAVESAVGAGATFRIYLPRVHAPVESLRPVVAPQNPGGPETILLVEDDEALRSVARGILSRAGYAVLEARTPEDALRIAERESGTIHLLLSDVVMPNLSGPELASRLAPLRPTTKVLLMSGYTDDEVLRHGVLDGRVAFLQKPITRESLTRKVREVLDGA